MRTRTLAAAAIAALAIATQSGAVAQSAPSPQASQAPTVAQAQARLQAQDLAGAVKILDAVVAATPDNFAAWRLLGSALIQTKEYDRAIVALERAVTLQPRAPVVLYNLACAHARAGHVEPALDALARAKATGGLDITQADTDPDLASVRSHAKFRALMPVEADFAAPFVEPVTIIREWRGEGANDQFGWIARNIGDVDGDRVADVVTSAPTRGGGAGRVYVYSTKTGALRWTIDGQAGDQLGMGIEAAGDTNRDGVPDVVASAPVRGEAYVQSGKDGARLLTLRGAGPAENFGRHVAGAGDLNRDGYADVIVGAPGRGTSSPDKGRAIVYSGKDGAALLTLEGEAAGDAFGSTVAGDPFGRSGLLIVGAPGAGPSKHGRAYVYQGLAPKPSFTIDADDTGAALGAMFASVAGDVDGDGTDDVYVSDWPNTAKGPNTGRAYVHSGKDGRRLHVFTGETAGEGLGTSPSSAGDVDGDGRADILIGAWQFAGAAPSGGRIYLYSGRTGARLRTYTDKTPWDTLGFDAVGLGDVNGDGTIDFLVTAAWSAVRGYHSGRVFVISSGVPRGKL